MVGTLFGFTFFLILLLLAVQTLVRLYAASVLTSAAFDAARSVATSIDEQAEVPVAQTVAQRSLGGLADHTIFTWLEVDGQQVVLRIAAQSPGFLPLPSSLRDVSRTVTVRTERFR
ncbi:MAG: hypothetical protein ACRDYC_12910 [Acidimicrobiales bacterium]